jgi:hypothetical protein
MEGESVDGSAAIVEAGSPLVTAPEASGEAQPNPLLGSEPAIQVTYP